MNLPPTKKLIKHDQMMVLEYISKIRNSINLGGQHVRNLFSLDLKKGYGEGAIEPTQFPSYRSSEKIFNNSSQLRHVSPFLGCLEYIVHMLAYNGQNVSFPEFHR
jgi:hypothetical protein